MDFSDRQQATSRHSTGQRHTEARKTGRRTIARWWRLVAAACCSLASLAASAGAQDRYQTIQQMHHTAWTARDGLVGRMNDLVQTTDGFLWIGSSNGLYRFDGVSFERFRPDQGELPGVSVETLLATADGGLWIGYVYGGATFLAADGSMVHYTVDDGLPVGQVRGFAVDGSGATWVSATGGLARLEGRRWHTVRHDWNYAHRSARFLVTDGAGGLWVSAESPFGLAYLANGSRQFTSVARDGVMRVFGRIGDREVAVLEHATGVLYAFRAEADGSIRRRPLLSSVPAYSVAVDPDGGFWIGGHGITRIRMSPGSSSAGPTLDGTPERFAPEDGLSGQYGDTVLVDRERNVWVLSESGLHRFRRRNLAWRSDAQLAGPASVLADHRGDAWAINHGDLRLWRLRDGLRAPGIPEGFSHGVAGPDGSVWLSSTRALYQWRDGTFTNIDPPAEVTRLGYQFNVRDVTVDASGRLWASLVGVGLFVREAGQWTLVPVLKDPGITPSRVQAGGDGRIWVAYTAELVARDAEGRTQTFGPAQGLRLGSIMALQWIHGRMWIAGERGLAYVDGGRVHPVLDAGGTDLGTVREIVPTRDGLWLSTGAGIVRIADAEVRRLLANPAARVRIELFDLVSDLPEPLKMELNMKAAIATPEGVAWFLTAGGVATLDPRLIVRNALPPPVKVRSLLADDRAYPVRGAAALPPLTRTIRIDYTALSLTIPERVKFRYRLEGWETGWHDAGTRRTVFYTDLRPGRYVFRVIASNNDGVWNETGASVAFSVAPAWYQTWAFQALVLVMGIALALVAHRARVRRVSAALSARFDERLAERTRIARDLHDTLLQTVQAGKMVADHALDAPEDLPRMQRAMRQLGDWLGRAVEEGRAALHALRASTSAVNELGDAFRRALEDLARPASMAAHVTVRGTVRELHPIVRDEIYLIGHEAIRNAFAHARATELRIELEYAKQITLRITDNGIGIPPEFAGAGKPGRFGIRGMHERAATIGASLIVERGPVGTRIVLIVPSRSLLRPPRSVVNPS